MDSKPNSAEEARTQRALPVIPTPPGTRWREFRVTYVPLVTFAALVLSIWVLWRQMPGSGEIRGIAEGAVSIITSPQDAFIQTVGVEPYNSVQEGEPVLTLSPFDPAANLDIFQSEIALFRMTMEPSLADRTVIDYEQLRVDALRLRQELAMAKANLERAEKVLPRHEALMKENLISQDVYDLTLRDRNYYRAQVDEITKSIGSIQERMESLQAMVTPVQPDPSSTNQLIPQLQARVKSMQTNWNPITLSAPIAGSVQLLRQQGEFVRRGEPIMVISSARADKVIGYMKQPFGFQPEVGMTMEVVTRSMNPQRFRTQITQVGARVEIITNAVAYIQTGMLVDTGLPVVMPVPDNAGVRPGELVDIVRRPSEGGNFVTRLFSKLN